MNDKDFLLFGGGHDYASGGADDAVWGRYATKEIAQEALTSDEVKARMENRGGYPRSFEWAHVAQLTPDGLRVVSRLASERVPNAPHWTSGYRNVWRDEPEPATI